MTSEITTATASTATVCIAGSQRSSTPMRSTPPAAVAAATHPDTRSATSVAIASTPAHVTNVNASSVHCTELLMNCESGVKKSTKIQLSPRLMMSQCSTWSTQSAMPKSHQLGIGLPHTTASTTPTTLT